MLHEQTVTKLQGMKLFGMLEALEEATAPGAVTRDLEGSRTGSRC